MSLGSGSNDDLILLCASLVRPGTNEAVLWVGEVTPEEELVRRGREGDFKMGTDGMSCEDSKQGSRKAQMGNFIYEIPEQRRHCPSWDQAGV